MEVSAAVDAEENMYTPQDGRPPWMQEEGSLASGDLGPCLLFLDFRFITHESGGLWDSIVPTSRSRFHVGLTHSCHHGDRCPAVTATSFYFLSFLCFRT